ncbi:hypothetical protein ABH931_006609 [Streptacidiphilus sp. MAP12-33]|uniref:hypothetical protein n=1 Tax=Streptacidiphilus sp. MAP12-33 TaxID=3156266 RepID=UPI0035151865
MSTTVNAHFAKLDQVRDVIHGARSEVVLVLRKTDQDPHRRVEVAAARNVADRGVGVRIYLTRSEQLPGAVSAATSAFPWPRVELVETDAALPRLAVVDQRTIMLPQAGEDYQDGALIATGLSIIPLVVWAVSAAGAREAQHLGHGAESDILDAAAGEVLHQMALGLKDDTAARNVGVSLRTYRRTVAQLMDRLNARSRFQAGYQAAQLGLQGPGGLPPQSWARASDLRSVAAADDLLPC